ncbi:MAG: HPr family phosphocarrier protein [Clostridiales bacterium]|nr:HPr family phosphocarrier protein [Clostridiales bacterium]
MVKQIVSIASGLEARPAALFVQTAGKFASNIRIRVNEKEANAKSIMGVISLGALVGHELEIIVDGNDEEQALLELQQFLGCA